MARFRTAALPLIAAGGPGRGRVHHRHEDDGRCRDDHPPAPNPRLTTMPLSPELDHLHGLHVDADGTVLAGTHSGLLALAPSGNTTRVGTSDDDLMGLSGVPGTDTLFSSGHPGPRATLPIPWAWRAAPMAE